MAFTVGLTEAGAPPVVLAPMAGITDLPFRRLVARFGASWTVSEMVASREMLCHRPGVREKAALGLDGSATAVQIAGCEAGPMAETARIVQAMGAREIDINMGCPAKKVTGGASGSALMRDEDHALRLIEAVAGAVSVPVTVKMRLGWDDDSRNAPSLARKAAEAGARRIAVHGRTRAQFYKGRADWRAIRATVEAAGVPVIANGDIAGPQSARAALAQSGAAGVMVGRGAQGAPWRVAEVAHALGAGPAPEVPEGAALAALVAEHHEALLGFYGRDLGLRCARKHLGWYMDGAGTGADLRRRVLTARDPAEVLALLPDAMAATGAGRKAA